MHGWRSAASVPICRNSVLLLGQAMSAYLCVYASRGGIRFECPMRGLLVARSTGERDGSRRTHSGINKGRNDNGI